MSGRCVGKAFSAVFASKFFIPSSSKKEEEKKSTSAIKQAPDGESTRRESEKPSRQLNDQLQQRSSNSEVLLFEIYILDEKPIKVDDTGEPSIKIIFPRASRASLFAAIADPRLRLGARSRRDLWINLPENELFSRSRLANRTRLVWKSLKLSWWSFSITLSGK